MPRLKENPDRRTLSVPEAARLLGIGRNQAYLAARAGDIPSIRIGDRILVLKEPFEKLLEGAA
jgi:excisionase family DNA binding protein